MLMEGIPSVGRLQREDRRPRCYRGEAEMRCNGTKALRCSVAFPLLSVVAAVASRSVVIWLASEEEDGKSPPNAKNAEFLWQWHCLRDCPAIFMRICLSIYLCVCLLICTLICLSICSSVCLSACPSSEHDVLSSI